MNHHLIGSDVIFDSWLVLCETAIEAAIKEARKQMENKIDDLIVSISDEIMETAEEYGPETYNQAC